MPDTLTIDVDGQRRVSGLVYRATGARLARLVLAHGAGAGQRHPFVVQFARGLADRGLDVVTFDFSYMEEGRRAPDPRARLEACYRSVIDAVRPRDASGAGAGVPLFVGGKSMGGRIATQVAATMSADDRAALSGVVALGYPLHPPGRPDKLRTAHLGDVGVPMLIVQGSRDTFGTPDELREHLADVADVAIHVVDGGDHSFKVPARDGRSREQVHADVQDAIAAWIARIPRSL